MIENRMALGTTESSFLIDLLWIKNTFLIDLKSLFCDASKEAALVSFMAGSTPDLAHLEQDSVAVAINMNGFYFLDISTFFAFSPKFLTTPTVIAGASGCEGLLIGFLVHVS